MKSRKIIIILICVILLILASGASVLGVKVYRHEKWQSQQINLLIQKNNELADQLAKLQGTFEDQGAGVEYSDSAYNYLAIGNSITLHVTCDYWWNEIGMAATCAENDFFHRVSAYLKDTYGDVNSYAMNYYTWEIQAADRAETYNIIDPYLDPQLDLITIQLSENISDMTTFEPDFEALLVYIVRKAPKAKIIVLDDFWNNDAKEEIKRSVVERWPQTQEDLGISDCGGVWFVSLDEIKGDPEYQCGLGTTVYDANGEPHTVEHDGVAIHPGDKGMEFITDAIIHVLQN